MQPQYQMGYDRAITVFSPDGRLYQVEYAREAVKRGTTAVGIKAKDGIVLLVDKRVNSKLLEPSSIEKIFRIDDHIGVASSGLVGDARSLVDRARVETQINRVSYRRRDGRGDAREEALRPHADLHPVRRSPPVRDGPADRGPLGGAVPTLRDRPIGHAPRVQGDRDRDRPERGHEGLRGRVPRRHDRRGGDRARTEGPACGHRGQVRRGHGRDRRGLERRSAVPEDEPRRGRRLRRADREATARRPRTGS